MTTRDDVFRIGARAGAQSTRLSGRPDDDQDDTFEITSAAFPLISEWLELPPDAFRERIDQLTALSRTLADQPLVHRAVRVLIVLLGELYRNKT